MSFYAVANGRNIGIFLNWNDCKKSVKDYKNARYKKFNTKEEAELYIKLNYKSIEINSLNIPDYYVYTDGACINNGKKNAILV